MKPYSIDLRQKIIDSYENKEGSIRQLAKRFKVSPDCVRRLLKRFYREGTIEPKRHAGGKAAKLQSRHLEVLKNLVVEDNDATLVELAQRLETRTSVQVSSSTISRSIKKLNLTRKKNFQGSRSLYQGEATSTLSILE